MINSKYRKLVLFLIAALSTSGCNSETIQQQQEVKYTHTVTSQKLDVSDNTNQLISQNTDNGQSVDQNNTNSFLPLWVWWLAFNNGSNLSANAQNTLNSLPRHNFVNSSNNISQIAKSTSTGKSQLFSNIRNNSNNISSSTPGVVRGSSNVSTYGGRSS